MERQRAIQLFNALCEEIGEDHWRTTPFGAVILALGGYTSLSIMPVTPEQKAKICHSASALRKLADAMEQER